MTRLGLTPRKHWLNVPINATTSISKFWFEVVEPGMPAVVLDNEGTGYVISQDRVLYVPMKSGMVAPDSEADPDSFRVVAAVSCCS